MARLVELNFIAERRREARGKDGTGRTAAGDAEAELEDGAAEVAAEASLVGAVDGDDSLLALGGGQLHDDGVVASHGGRRHAAAQNHPSSSSWPRRHLPHRHHHAGLRRDSGSSASVPLPLTALSSRVPSASRPVGSRVVVLCPLLLLLLLSRKL